jgi:hypothetical protein
MLLHDMTVQKFAFSFSPECVLVVLFLLGVCQWVSVDSPRIQPKFFVGERLLLKDSVGKDSEALVREVAIRENALKILVHYVHWSSKSVINSLTTGMRRGEERKGSRPLLFISDDVLVRCAAVYNRWDEVRA